MPTATMPERGAVPRTPKPRAVHPYEPLKALHAEAVRLKLPRLAREVLMQIAYYDYRRDGSEVFVGVSTLAKEVGYRAGPTSEFYGALDRTEAAGLLRVRRKPTWRSLRTIVGYVVLWPAAEAGETRASQETGETRVHKQRHPADASCDRKERLSGEAEKNDKRRATAALAPDLQRKDRSAIEAAVALGGDDPALAERFLRPLAARYLREFGADALREKVADVAKRRPKTMRNRGGYLVTCLRSDLEETDLEAYFDAIERLDLAWDEEHSDLDADRLNAAARGDYYRRWLRQRMATERAEERVLRAERAERRRAERVRFTDAEFRAAAKAARVREETAREVRSLLRAEAARKAREAKRHEAEVRRWFADRAAAARATPAPEHDSRSDAERARDWEVAVYGDGTEGAD